MTKWIVCALIVYNYKYSLHTAKGNYMSDSNVMIRLEEKIEEILRRISSLKAENEDLRQKLNETYALREKLEAKERELSEMNELLAVQDAERAEIRARVEALVAKLEVPQG